MAHRCWGSERPISAWNKLSCRGCEKGCCNGGMKLSPLLYFPTAAVAAATTRQASLRTPETAARICAAIRETGLSDLHAAALAGVSSAAMIQWRQEDGEFASRLDAAREELRNACLREIRQARNRDGSPDRQAQAWLRKHGFEE
jgi:hypothetical protein